MRRRWWSSMLLVSALPGLPAVADAHCLWVLWENSWTTVDPASLPWTPEEERELQKLEELKERWKVTPPAVALRPDWEKEAREEIEVSRSGRALVLASQYGGRTATPKDFFQTREACQTALKVAEAQAVKPEVQKPKEGVSRTFHYQCWPDTLDPRGPRG